MILPLIFVGFSPKIRLFFLWIPRDSCSAFLQEINQKLSKRHLQKILRKLLQEFSQGFAKILHGSLQLSSTGFQVIRLVALQDLNQWFEHVYLQKLFKRFLQWSRISPKILEKKKDHSFIQCIFYELPQDVFQGIFLLLGVTIMILQDFDHKFIQRFVQEICSAVSTVIPSG